MTITLTLPLELEQRLTEAAERQGLPVDAYALRLLEQQVPSDDHRAELLALLQSWIDEVDAEGQRDTGEYLVRVLDEDRLSERKLFPQELKDVTW